MKNTTPLTSLVERLLADERLQDRLRHDPATFQREYGLSDEELDALLTGDELRLIALGVEPSTFHPRSSDPSWLSAALMRVGAPAMAVLAALGVTLAPSAPTASAARRARMGIVVRRVRRARRVRVRVHPMARRAARRSGIRRGSWVRTDVRMARFAKARAFGTYSDTKSALAALQQVDPNISLPGTSIGKGD